MTTMERLAAAQERAAAATEDLVAFYRERDAFHEDREDKRRDAEIAAAFERQERQHSHELELLRQRVAADLESKDRELDRMWESLKRTGVVE